MTSHAESYIRKAVGVLVFAAGLSFACFILFWGLPRAVAGVGLAQALLFVVPVLGFPCYISYLGYAVFFRASRSAFERVWLLVAIMIAVIFGRHFSFLPAIAFALGLALLTLAIRPFVTRQLFRDDDHV